MAWLLHAAGIGYYVYYKGRSKDKAISGIWHLPEDRWRFIIWHKSVDDPTIRGLRAEAEDDEFQSRLLMPTIALEDPGFTVSRFKHASLQQFIRTFLLEINEFPALSPD